MYDLERLITTTSYTEDIPGESDNESFLSEIVEATSTVSLIESRSQRFIEWPEFMAMRCRVAKGCLKQNLRNEAKLRVYGFVPSLPLYSFDFSHYPRWRRPEISEVKSSLFADLVEYINELGFSCFIDRPGLTSWYDRKRHRRSSPEVSLSDFGLYDFQYFDEIGAPESERKTPRQVHWALYVLLPGHEAPPFSLRRYFRYNRDPLSPSHILLKTLIVVTPLSMFAAIFYSMILMESNFGYELEEPDRAVLNEMRNETKGQ